jgi:hypothetical protein
VSAGGRVLDPGGRRLTWGVQATSLGLAWTGSSYLLAYAAYGDDDAIRVLRLDGDGRPLGAPAVLTRAPHAEPTLARAGSRLLLAWSTVPAGLDREQVRATRLTPDGRVLDGAGFLVAPSAEGQSSPSATGVGHRFLLSWQQHRLRADGGYLASHVRAARIGADGTVVDRGGFPVTAGPAVDVSPRVSAAGADVLVTWYRLDVGVLATRLTGRTVLDRQPLTLSRTDAGPAAVAGGPGGWFTVWQRRVWSEPRPVGGPGPVRRGAARRRRALRRPADSRTAQPGGRRRRRAAARRLGRQPGSAQCRVRGPDAAGRPAARSCGDQAVPVSGVGEPAAGGFRRGHVPHHLAPGGAGPGLRRPDHLGR